MKSPPKYMEGGITLWRLWKENDRKNRTFELNSKQLLTVLPKQHMSGSESCLSKP